MTDKKRGGSRPGAGRPSQKSGQKFVTFGLSLPEPIAVWWKAMPRSERMPLARAVADALGKIRRGEDVIVAPLPNRSLVTVSPSVRAEDKHWYDGLPSEQRAAVQQSLRGVVATFYADL